MSDRNTEKTALQTRQLLDKLLLGDLPPETAERVRRWYADQENRELKDSVIDELAGQIAAEKTPSELARRKYVELAARLGLSVPEFTGAKMRTWRRSTVRAWRMAAVIMLPLAIAGAVLALLLIGRAPDNVAVTLVAQAPQVVVTADPAVTQSQAVALADGSRIALAPGSTLQYAEGAREVSLQGQAWFDVAAADGAPFTVRTRHAVITVLGTEFRVIETAGETLVALFSGAVSVEGSGQTARLDVGEMLRLDTAAGESATERMFTPSAGGGMSFEGKTLGAILQTIEWLYGVKVNYSRAGGIRLDETYFMDIARGESLDTVLFILSNISQQFDYTICANTIHLKSK